MATLKRQRNNLRSILTEATQYRYSAFHQDESVNGADLVEWFAVWRQRALRELENIRADDARALKRAVKRVQRDNPRL